MPSKSKWEKCSDGSYMMVFEELFNGISLCVTVQQDRDDWHWSVEDDRGLHWLDYGMQPTLREAQAAGRVALQKMLRDEKQKIQKIINSL